MANKLKLVKSGKNYDLYTDEKGVEHIKIKNVRVSYPHFGTPGENEDDNGKKTTAWGGVAMLSKDTHVEAKDAFVAIMNRLIETNKVKIGAEYKCIKNGDDKDKAEYENHWVINFSDKNRRPAVRDNKGEIILDVPTIDDMFYGGCWINVMLRPWYFDGKAKGSNKTFPKRICCGFVGAQFVRNDTAFGEGRVDDDDAWDTVGDSDDDGMGGDSSSGGDDDGL